MSAPPSIATTRLPDRRGGLGFSASDPRERRGRRVILAAMGSLMVVVLAVAMAGLVRAKTAAGLLGRREALGPPLSDWAAPSPPRLGLGGAGPVARVPGPALLLLAAVLGA